MAKDYKRNPEIEEQETSEWLYSLDYVFEHGGPERVKRVASAASNTSTQSRSSYSILGKHSVHKYNPKRKAAAISRATEKLKEE